MKITTWNINGIRSLKKNIDDVLKELSADVICFQETKVSRSQLPETIALIDGYTSYFSYPRKQSGYSGVATYCKDSFIPEDADEGLSQSFQEEIDDYTANILHHLELYTENTTEFDSEGRVMTTHHLIKYGNEIQRLSIINIYCPRVDPEKFERHLYKMKFCNLLELKMRELCRKGCSVIILGDLNIAASIIDHCDPGDEQVFNSSEARKWLKTFLSSTLQFSDGNIGVIDAFRHFYPDGRNAYTCWNTKTGARLTNYGTRIDYILLSSNLLPLLESCEILADYHGSDHCPVSAVLKCDSVPCESLRLPSICTRLWPEFSGQQQKLQAFLQKTQTIADSLTMCADSPTKSEIMKPRCNNTKSSIKKSKQKTIMNFFKVPNVTPSNGSVSAKLQECTTEEHCVANSSGISDHEPSSSKTSISSDQEFLSKAFISSDQELLSKNNYEDISSSSQNNQSTVWKSLLTGPPKPPFCTGHKKECVLRTVRKKGPNCGRQFFMCAQPPGPPSNPDASCNFFKWAFMPKINKFKNA